MFGLFNMKNDITELKSRQTQCLSSEAKKEKSSSVLADMPTVAHSHFPCLPLGTKRTPGYHLLPTQSHFCKLLVDPKHFFPYNIFLLFYKAAWDFMGGHPLLIWQTMDEKESSFCSLCAHGNVVFNMWIESGWQLDVAVLFLCAGWVRLITATTQLLDCIHILLFTSVPTPHLTHISLVASS